MIEGYTRNELLDASKTCHSMAKKEGYKSIGAMVLGAGMFAYGLMRFGDYGYLRAKEDVYRKIGHDTLNVFD